MPSVEHSEGKIEDQAVHSLRRRSLAWLFFGWLMTALCYFLLKAEDPTQQYWAFIIVPVSTMVVFWVFLAGHLQNNRRIRGGELLSHFGLGNAISIFRGLEVILLAGFIFIPQPQRWTAWIPAILYTSADILDYLDGYAARVRNEVTQLGEELDQLFDGAGLLVATVLAVQYGTLSWWFLPFGAARYLFLFGLWFRRKRGLPVYELTDSRSRRPIAGLTMGFMTAMLWPIVKPPASIIAGLLFMLPFGASFLRDWLVVSGSIDPQSERYLKLREWLEKLIIRYLPVVVRLILLGILGWDTWITFSHFDEQVAMFELAGFPAPSVSVPLFAIIKLAAIPLLFVGAAGRFVAFILIFPIGLTIVRVGVSELRIGLLVSDLLVLMLGTGKYSLWEPAKHLFGRRAGDRDG
jgi:CDP-diacylglycerol--glycerol-3-phosphate 3-phosphatidyltransferase